MADHQHRPKDNLTRERPFSGPARGASKQNPKAHGGFTVVETCGCGAMREINVNRTWVERGAWIEAEAPRGRGQPPLREGEETYKVDVRLGARDLDRLLAYAEQEGHVFDGRPSAGRAARALILEGLKNT